jgi:hypothetical protein
MGLSFGVGRREVLTGNTFGQETEYRRINSCLQTGGETYKQSPDQRLYLLAVS